MTSPGLDEYEIDFGSLILGQELGQGAFGRVLKGYMKYYPNILKQTSDGKSPAVAVKLTKGKVHTKVWTIVVVITSNTLHYDLPKGRKIAVVIL